jgi:hypothetical protein
MIIYDVMMNRRYEDKDNTPPTPSQEGRALASIPVLDSMVLGWCGNFDVTVRYSRRPQEVFTKCLQGIRKSRALTLSPPLLRGEGIGEHACIGWCGFGLVWKLRMND